MKSKIVGSSKQMVWSSERFGKRSNQDTVQPMPEFNQEPQYSPVLADAWTMDRTMQNRTKQHYTYQF